MNHDNTWQKLVASARRAPEADLAMPIGFSTRIAARGLAAAGEGRDWFGMFAFRALLLAVAIMITTAAASSPWISGGGNSADAENDPVGELVAAL